MDHQDGRVQMTMHAHPELDPGPCDFCGGPTIFSFEIELVAADMLQLDSRQFMICYACSMEDDHRKGHRIRRLVETMYQEQP